MKMKTIVTCALAAFCLMAFAQQGERRRRPDSGERPRRHAMGGEYGGERSRRSSGDGERRRPQLSEETRRLIAAYQRDPTEANKAKAPVNTNGAARDIVEGAGPHAPRDRQGDND